MIALILTSGTPEESKTGKITYELLYEDGNGEGTHWGDSNNGRQIYTKKELNVGALGESITFNSITDGDFGDERNFVGAALVGGRKSVWYGDAIEVEDGQTYVISLYIHNDNPDGLNAIAEDVRASFSLPTTASNSHSVIGYIDSSNAEPSRYWDAVTLYAEEAFYIEYIEGSARYINSGMNGISLTDDVVAGGTPIGYDRFDGKLPGGEGYAGIVTIEVAVHSSVESKLTIKGRLKGTSHWAEQITANVGDVIEFQIEYKNLSANNVSNVMIRDILPENLHYVDGSTFLYNSEYSSGSAVESDTIATSGVNIGNYAAKSDAYVRFSAKIVNNSLAAGENQLVNWAQATVEEKVYKDDVSVFVLK